MKYIQYSWVVLLFFCSAHLFSQDSTAQQIRLTQARQHLQHLKDGILVVRIPTNSNKVNELRRLLISKEISSDFRREVEEQLDETLRDRENLAWALRQSFKDIYKFGDRIMFMPDSLSGQLYDGIRKGIFLNDDMELESSITIEKEKQVYIAYIGRPPLETTSGKKSLMLADAKGNLLALPFPRAVNFYTFFAFVDFKSSDDYYVPKAVERLQKELEKYSEAWLK